MSTILVTGATRGIGREVARELVNQGHNVYFGTRDLAVDTELVDDIEGIAHWLAIDTSNSDSIRAAAERFGELESQLDILINNAGIYPDQGLNILDISRERMVDTLQTNTFGPLEVVQEFLPYLTKATQPRIINVSSGLGQITGLSADNPSYCLSKLALNGITLMLAEKLKDQVAVNSVCPGWVKTDMGGENAPRSIPEGAAGILWLALEADPTLTGGFYRDGKPIEW
jgi:NAD(P)-dependent dehydrogenase (short-subunit alcohol dehydrogenase family)